MSVIDFHFFYEDTQIKPCDVAGKFGYAWKVNNKKWVGLIPYNSHVAHAISLHFKSMAKAYEKQEKKKKQTKKEKTK